MKTNPILVKGSKLGFELFKRKRKTKHVQNSTEHTLRHLNRQEILKQDPNYSRNCVNS